jgi:hypothetical protein
VLCWKENLLIVNFVPSIDAGVDWKDYLMKLIHALIDDFNSLKSVTRCSCLSCPKSPTLPCYVLAVDFVEDSTKRVW